MCPTYAFVNRSNGKFNEAMGFTREYAALFSAFWDNDYALFNYLQDPEADSYDTLKDMGIVPRYNDEVDARLLHQISHQITA